MSGIYDVTLTPGASANLGVLGGYLKVRSAPFGLVQVKLDGGEAFMLDEGLGFRLQAGKTFRDVTVTNRSGTTQTVLLFIGDALFEDSRITGAVSITNKIGAGVQHTTGTSPTAVGTGQTSALLLPAANPRGILIRQSVVTAVGQAGGQAVIRVIAAPVVPAQAIPPNSYQMAGIVVNGAAQSQDLQSNQNYIIPAGFGVWTFSDITTAALASSNWELQFEAL